MEQRPHGLDIGSTVEILDKGVIETTESRIEGWIELEESKSGRKLSFPARSLVSNFITALRGYFASSATVFPLSVSQGASISSSLAKKFGILVGESNSAVALGDTALGTKIAHASLPYKGTTFVAPNVAADNVMNFEVQRLFSNISDSYYFEVAEVGVLGNKVGNAASAATSGKLLSRDVVTSIYQLDPSTDVRVGFKFKVTQGGTGGAVLNLIKMIFNSMFIGNYNYSLSRLVTRTNALLSTAFSTASAATANNPFYMGGLADIYCGIVVGRYDNPNVSTGDQASTPAISPDETTFTVDHTNLTVGANTISAIVNVLSNTAQFTVVREFTNSSTSANKTLNRFGLLGKGDGTAASPATDQCFMCINKFSTDSVTLQPGQTLKVTYTFTIKV